VGREARCRCRWGDSEGDVQALLETEMLILRGDLKGVIPIANMERVHVEGEALCFALALGADVAAR
jgi:hypothetical protein